MSTHSITPAPEASLDSAVKRWIRNIADSWRTTENDAAQMLGSDEIANRTRQYPLLDQELRNPRPKMSQISKLLHECYTFMHRFDAIRLTNFFDAKQSASAVLNLIRDFPKTDRDGAIRIDAFVENAVNIAYKNPEGGNDYAGAALLASVILTSLERDRFVDFRHHRWVNLAKALNYQFPETDSDGEWLVNAGHFAKLVSRTTSFQNFWPDQEPLWTLAGLCWMGVSPERPPEKDWPPVDFPHDEGFPEGGDKQSLHYGHERNRTVVQRAKLYGWQRDRTLPCEVCGFSFAEAYGKFGEKFIEAHHKIPVAVLVPGHRTMVEDIALVCANCHRMLHCGENTLSIEELKNLLRN